MTTSNFQNILRSRHIIIDSLNLDYIPCNRGGLMTLNSLKEIVNLEGKFSHIL